jgi:hypothetical protein
MQYAWATKPAKKLLDAFLLREPEKVAVAQSTLQHETTARYDAAAKRRIRVARDLPESEGAVALALYREAAVFLIAALGQSSHDERVELSSSAAEAWRKFDEYPRPASHAKTPDRLANAREVLANDDPLAPDALGPTEVRDSVAAAAETVAWLSSALEPRSQSEIRGTRRLRIVGAVALAVFLLYELAVSLFSSKNLALNRPATASSQRPGSPDATGVDNGEVERGFGVHTNVDPNPWVRIDLGASVPIHEVRVYNRGDGYPPDNLPLVLQLSDDDNAYTDIEERSDLFTREQPWIAKLVGKRARYVRVYMPKQGYIALSEIEVY